ncbi:hypothetical protein AWE51_10405 [Aquimarina aggregata]|uniref:Lipoprotein n=1 Tax=Aquimarina aggregata TaxID=1642818 RepID=A0A162Y7D6_9FLAO|nr:hypothetical protein [Aquimarina aggregata]KZS38971.1 hypothetical protein AWE51_10405 [Aquimarina aggregata]
MNKIKLILGFLIIGLSSCSNTADSNNLDSDDYDKKDERIKTLEKEIKSFSEIKNAEFELFNVNGFSNSRTTVPGASSWDYKFAIKVNPSDIDKWTTGLIKIELNGSNKEWMNKIIEKRKNDWKTKTEPEFYTRKEDNVTVAVYKLEGIIFKRVINN